MQYWSPIYTMLRQFGRKTLNSIKGFIYYKKIPQNNVLSKQKFLQAPLVKVLKILRSFNKTNFKNCIFIIKSLKGLLPSLFNSRFKSSFESHSHYTGWSNLDYLKIPSYRTKTYVRYPMFLTAIYVWNHLQSCHQNVIFQLRANKLKETITFF